MFIGQLSENVDEVKISHYMIVNSSCAYAQNQQSFHLRDS